MYGLDMPAKAFHKQNMVTKPTGPLAERERAGVTKAEEASQTGNKFAIDSKGKLKAMDSIKRLLPKTSTTGGDKEITCMDQWVLAMLEMEDWIAELCEGMQWQGGGLGEYIQAHRKSMQLLMRTGWFPEAQSRGGDTEKKVFSHFLRFEEELRNLYMQEKENKWTIQDHLEEGRYDELWQRCWTRCNQEVLGGGGGGGSTGAGAPQPLKAPAPRARPGGAAIGGAAAAPTSGGGETSYPRYDVYEARYKGFKVPGTQIWYCTKHSYGGECKRPKHDVKGAGQCCYRERGGALGRESYSHKCVRCQKSHAIVQGSKGACKDASR